MKKFLHKNLLKCFKNHCAFTLAEVLITLGIIGVVAALTIPTLMTRTQDLEYKSALKKVYSSLSQTYLKLSGDNGGAFTGATSTCSDSDCFRNLFKNNMNVISTCDAGNVQGVCFPNDSSIKFLNGNAIVPWATASVASSSGMILSDGTSVILQLDSPTCNSNSYNPRTDYCGWITVDVNGLKAPNTWGRDIYTFFIFGAKVLPNVYDVGSSGNPVDDCGVGTNYGQTCASKYLLN